MYVSVNGRVKNKKFVHGYINVLLHALKLNRLKRDLEIEFVTTCDGLVLGWCWGDKDEVSIQIARNDGSRNLSFIEMMKTLTHEMVHAKQFFRGELINEGGSRMWKGKKADDYSYENCPWEKEAYRMEKELFDEWFPFFEKFNN